MTHVLFTFSCGYTSVGKILTVTDTHVPFIVILPYEGPNRLTHASFTYKGAKLCRPTSVASSVGTTAEFIDLSDYPELFI